MNIYEGLDVVSCSFRYSVIQIHDAQVTLFFIDGFFSYFDWMI